MQKITIECGDTLSHFRVAPVAIRRFGVFEDHQVLDSNSFTDIEQYQFKEDQHFSSLFCRSIFTSQNHHESINLDSLPNQWFQYDAMRSQDVDFSNYSGVALYQSYWATTNIEANEKAFYQFDLAICGSLTLWLNGKKVCQYTNYDYNQEQRFDVALELEKGMNELVIFIDQLMERQTQFFFKMTSKSEHSLCLCCDENPAFELANLTLPHLKANQSNLTNSNDDAVTLDNLNQLIQTQNPSSEQIQQLIEFCHAALQRVSLRTDKSINLLLGLIWIYKKQHNSLNLSKHLLNRIKSSVLGYRYWSDEIGNDVMWFWSVDQSIHYHVCQLLAAELFPQDKFITSSRYAEQQQAIAKDRLNVWFEKVEANPSLLEGAQCTNALIALAALSAESSLVHKANFLLDMIGELPLPKFNYSQDVNLEDLQPAV
ncbi:MAG: hypothetical protein ACK5NC_13700 [Vibrio sp.]